MPRGKVDLREAGRLRGVLPEVQGGTGHRVYEVGDMLQAVSPNRLVRVQPADIVGLPTGRDGFTYPRRTTEITSTEVWYYCSVLSASGNPSSFATAGGTGTIKAFPFWSGAFDLTVIRLAFRVQVIGGGGAVARVGIYNSAADGTIYPTSLVVDGGEFSTTTTGVKSATISETLTRDTLYWFAYLGGTSSANINGFNTDDCWSPLGHQSWGTKHMGWSHSQTYGALPSTFPSGTPAVLGNFSIAIGVRATT